jgi:hypothetical protein
MARTRAENSRMSWSSARLKIKLTLVANQSASTPRSEFIDSLSVPGGMNVVDRRIVELVAPGDLVIGARPHRVDAVLFRVWFWRLLPRASLPGAAW